MPSIFNYWQDIKEAKRRLKSVFADQGRIEMLYATYKKLKWYRLLHKTRKKQIQIGPYVLSGFEFDTLLYLFKDVFVSGDYYFNSKSEKPLIIDAGANIGTTILFFKWLYPNAIIHAFEPSPSIFKQLEDNINTNQLKDVYLHNVALSDQTEILKFYEPEGVEGSLTGSVHKARNDGKAIDVQAIKFSDFICQAEIEMIDYLKMDIEGAENAVINDLAEANLLKKVKQAGIEYHHQIGGSMSSFANFLQTLEKHDFQYSICAEGSPNQIQNMQDIHLYLLHK